MLCLWSRPNPLQWSAKNDQKIWSFTNRRPRCMMLALCFIPIPVTAKQPLDKGFYMHSSTDEQKANTSSHQQPAPRPLVPTHPSVSPSLFLCLSEATIPLYRLSHKLLKSRLMTSRPPKAQCLHTRKSMYLCEQKICAHPGLAGNFTLCL